MPSRPNSQPPARHVALIADGNRRWARARGLPVSAGYEAGADTLKARLADAIELGVEELTVYSFSTGNWSRPAEAPGTAHRLALRRVTTAVEDRSIR